jgi:hypothetical protein
MKNMVFERAGAIFYTQNMVFERAGQPKIWCLSAQVSQKYGV